MRARNRTDVSFFFFFALKKITTYCISCQNTMWEWLWYLLLELSGVGGKNAMSWFVFLYINRYFKIRSSTKCSVMGSVSVRRKCERLVVFQPVVRVSWYLLFVELFSYMLCHLMLWTWASMNEKSTVCSNVRKQTFFCVLVCVKLQDNPTAFYKNSPGSLLCADTSIPYVMDELNVCLGF